MSFTSPHCLLSEATDLVTSKCLVPAYVSWVRFYASYRKDAKAAFNFKEVHLGHYAKSFALRDPPSAIGGVGRQQWQRKR